MGPTVAGMPLSAPLPEGSSMNLGGDEMSVLAPGGPFRRR